MSVPDAGQFAIFPWFPPHDTDVSGIRWIEVMQRLSARHPRVVVPGHGEVRGARLMADVRTYLELLRDETWRRRDSAMSEATIVEEVSRRTRHAAGCWVLGAGCWVLGARTRSRGARW
ncbi:hypothetical protein [Streptomyces akebiae]|uniref:hypothetical protein n=1 Tax=Streptomyces akebiae TaxID=2865673 RepID=UPI002175E044|nr:hypothetical protein [Streptomyces akebiae]